MIITDNSCIHHWVHCMTFWSFSESCPSMGYTTLQMCLKHFVLIEILLTPNTLTISNHFNISGLFIWQMFRTLICAQKEIIEKITAALTSDSSICSMVKKAMWTDTLGTDRKLKLLGVSYYGPEWCCESLLGWICTWKTEIVTSEQQTEKQNILMQRLVNLGKLAKNKTGNVANRKRC